MVLLVALYSSTLFAQPMPSDSEDSDQVQIEHDATAPAPTDAADDASAEERARSASTSAAPAESNPTSPEEPSAPPAPDQSPAATGWENQPSEGQSWAAADEIDGDLYLMSLEELLQIKVVSATRTESNVNDAPSIISVITREQLQVWGQRTVCEVLRSLPGFYIVDDHIIPDVMMRGISGGLMAESSFIKVLINGHSVAFRSTGGNWLGPELIPMTMVERIEVVRGPASALFGSDAFLGVINIITRKDQAEDANFAAMMGMGASGKNLWAYDLESSAWGNTGDFDYRAAVRVSSADHSAVKLPTSSPNPELPTYNEGHKRARGLNLDSLSALAQLDYRLTDDTTLTLAPRFSRITRGAEFAVWSVLSHGLDEGGRQRGTTVQLQQAALDIDFTSNFTDDLRLAFAGSTFWGAPGEDDHIDVGSDLYYVDREFWYVGQDAVLQLDWQILEEVMVVGGAELNVDHEQLPSVTYVSSVNSGDIEPGEKIEEGSFLRSRKTFYNAGVFAQVVWKLDSLPLQITGGVRFDFNSTYDSQPSGRLALVSSPFDWLTLKLLYGTAFKAPSPFLLHGTPLQVGDVLGNPALKPQRVHTVELEVRWIPDEVFVLTTDVAYNLVLNASQFTLDGTNMRAHNIARLHTISWETTAQVQPHERVTGYAFASITMGQRDINTMGYVADLMGLEVPVYPSIAFGGGASWLIPVTQLRVNVEATYYGERRASETNAIEKGELYTMPAYAIVDARLQSPELDLFGDHPTVLSLRVTNLLGIVGPMPGFVGVDYPLPPRTMMFYWQQEL